MSTKIEMISIPMAEYERLMSALGENKTLRADNERLRTLLQQLVNYTEACEGLMNVTPAGQVLNARAALAASPASATDWRRLAMDYGKAFDAWDAYEFGDTPLSLRVPDYWEAKERTHNELIDAVRREREGGPDHAAS